MSERRTVVSDPGLMVREIDGVLTLLGLQVERTHISVFNKITKEEMHGPYSRDQTPHSGRESGTC